MFFFLLNYFVFNMVYFSSGLMMSLFGSFDYSNFDLSCFFGFFFIMVFFFTSTLYLSLFSCLFDLFYSSISHFFCSSGSIFHKSSLIVMILFFSLLFFNFVSVGPYNFVVTSQISVVFFSSLTFWSSIFLFSLFNNFMGVLGHMIPEGTPFILTWFIFLIEMISNFIRSLTLFVRLLANILSGHLLMCLLSGLIFLFPPFFIVYVGLDLIESIVSFVQAFIFATMITIYYSEL